MILQFQVQVLPEALNFTNYMCIMHYNFQSLQLTSW